MGGRYITNCIEYIRWRASKIEQQKTYNKVQGIVQDLPTIQYETLELVVDRLREYDRSDTSSASDYYEVPKDVDMDNVALQEPDIFI